MTFQSCENDGREKFKKYLETLGYQQVNGNDTLNNIGDGVSQFSFTMNDYCHYDCTVTASTGSKMLIEIKNRRTKYDEWAIDKFKIDALTAIQDHNPEWKAYVANIYRNELWIIPINMLQSHGKIETMYIRHRSTVKNDKPAYKQMWVCNNSHFHHAIISN